MKTLKTGILSALLLGAVISSALAGDDTKVKAKAYTLDTCAVCGMKFGARDKPYTFVYKEREIKVCDQDEAAEFKKEPAKYLKKVEAAEAKAKKVI